MWVEWPFARQTVSDDGQLRITHAAEGKVDFELNIQKDHTVRSASVDMFALAPG